MYVEQIEEGLPGNSLPLGCGSGAAANYFKKYPFNYVLAELAGGRLPEPAKVKPEPVSPIYDSTDWLLPLVDPKKRRLVVEKAAETLTEYKKNHHFDAIAVRGFSGLGLGSIISYLIDAPLVCVRKHTTHDSRLVFGQCNASKYIIIDDFTATGETVRTIHDEVVRTAGKWGFSDPELVAVFTYNRDYSNYRDIEKVMGGYMPSRRTGVAPDILFDVPLIDLMGRDKP